MVNLSEGVSTAREISCSSPWLRVPLPAGFSIHANAQKKHQHQCQQHKGTIGNGLGDVNGLRVEAEDQFVFSGWNANGTQHIVGTGNVGRLAVYGASPARIVYLAQHNYTSRLAIYLISKAIGLVIRKLYRSRRIGLRSIRTKDFCELLVHNSNISKVRTAQSRQFASASAT